MTDCWSCKRSHTGGVWCPHCSAPVDPESTEARSSPFWAQDPRNPASKPPSCCYCGVKLSHLHTYHLSNCPAWRP